MVQDNCCHDVSRSMDVVGEVSPQNSQAQALYRQSEALYFEKKYTESKYFGRNALVSLFNDGDYFSVIEFAAEHIARFADDIFSRLLYCDALRCFAAQLQDQYPEQASQLLDVAVTLEREEPFLRQASEEEIRQWWHSLGDDADRSSLLPLIGNLIRQSELDRSWMLYRLIQDRLSPVEEAGLLPGLALNLLLSDKPDCRDHRAIMDRWMMLSGDAIATQSDPLLWPEMAVPRDRPLRIGFLDMTELWRMPNYREVLLRPTLQALGEAGYDVFYVINDVAASVARRVSLVDMPSMVDAWAIQIMGDAAAQEVAGLDLDVLLLVNGLVSNPPVKFFASRPAKRLAMWLHTFATYGGDLIDAIVVDEHSYTQAHAEMSAEPAVGLCGLPFLVGQSRNAPPVAEAPCVRNGYVTFGVVGRAPKWSRDCFLAWGRILSAVPTARLRLHGLSNLTDADYARVLDEMTACGVLLERVDFTDFIGSHAEYLESLAGVDIVLDTYPFAGGLSTAEAIWQGVPVVSRLGESILSRTGLVYLGETHLRPLVVSGEDAFCQTAIALAEDPEALVRLRQSMRAKLEESRLMNSALFLPRFQAAMDELLALTPRCLARLRARRQAGQALT